MSGFREKITPFTLGLSLGLLAACLFFIFKLDDYIRKIDLTSLTQKNKISEEIVNSKNGKEDAGKNKEEKTANRRT